MTVSKSLSARQTADADERSSEDRERFPRAAPAIHSLRRLALATVGPLAVLNSRLCVCTRPTTSLVELNKQAHCLHLHTRDNKRHDSVC